MTRGKVPSLLSVNTGRPRRTTVKRKSACKRCNKELHSGDVCAEIPNHSGHKYYKRYCLSCFTEILAKTKSDLAKIETDIFSKE